MDKRRNAASEMTPRQAIKNFPQSKSNNENDVKKILKDDSNDKKAAIAPPPIGIPPIGNNNTSSNPYTKQSTPTNSNSKPPPTNNAMPPPPMPMIFDPNKNNNTIQKNNNKDISSNNIIPSQPSIINPQINQSKSMPISSMPNTITNNTTNPTINNVKPMINTTPIPTTTNASTKNFSPTPTNASRKKKSSSSSSLFEKYLILLNYFLSLGIILTSIIIVLIAISVQKHRDFSMIWLYDEFKNGYKMTQSIIINIPNNIKNFNIDEFKSYFKDIFNSIKK